MNIGREKPHLDSPIISSDTEKEEEKDDIIWITFNALFFHRFATENTQRKIFKSGQLTDETKFIANKFSAIAHFLTQQALAQISREKEETNVGGRSRVIDVLLALDMYSVHGGDGVSGNGTSTGYQVYHQAAT